MAISKTPKLKYYLIIFFAGLIFMIHFSIIVFYIEDYVNLDEKLLRNNTNYVLIHLLQTANNHMDQQQLVEHVNYLANSKLKLNNFDIKISLTKQPLWQLRFDDKNSLKNLEDYVRHADADIKFSLLLKNGMWLNYLSSLSHNFYMIAMTLIILELAIICFILFYGWAIWRFTIPLRQFKQSAERLGIDVNASPIEASGPAIVRETANAINKMQKRINDLIESRTKMLAAISHDLRTPITRLKLRAQFINDEKQSEKIINNLDEMETMIASFLDFAKSDITSERKVKFDVKALLQSICYDFTDMGHLVHFYTEEEGRIPILGRTLALKRTFINLIENAIKYGGYVEVKLNHVSKKFVKIVIEDNGPGIPQEELTKVFEPYYRSATSQAKSIAGTGLGLTIAHEVIRTHDGSITLENRQEGGLRVIVLLPSRLL